MKRIVLLLLCSAIFIQCNKSNCGCTNWTNKMDDLFIHNAAKISIDQGVAGTLYMIEGNCMPPVGEGSTCKSFPIQREIYLYEYTTMSDVVSDGPTTFTEINTTLVAQTLADQEGFFQIAVDTGVYSLFIEEDGKFYANGFDGTGGIQTLRISTDSVLTYNPRIDYAVY